MKPILSVIAVLASFGLAQAATVFSTTNSNTPNDSYDACRGFATKLTSPGVLTTTSGGTTATLPPTVYLDDISLTTSNSSDSYEAFKIAVYSYTAEGTVGELVALSSNSNAWARGTTLTFNFDSVALNSTSTYQYLFVKAATTWDDLNKTAGSQNYNAYWDASISEAVSMSSYTSGVLPEGNGLYSNNALTSPLSNLPAVTFTTSNEAVPEPTSATLGLLGLGSLLLRRRRR